MDEVGEYVARYRRAVKGTRVVRADVHGLREASSILREVEAKGLMNEFVKKMEKELDERYHAYDMGP